MSVPNIVHKVMALQEWHREMFGASPALTKAGRLTAKAETQILEGMRETFQRELPEGLRAAITDDGRLELRMGENAVEIVGFTDTGTIVSPVEESRAHVDPKSLVTADESIDVEFDT